MKYRSIVRLLAIASLVIPALLSSCSGQDHSAPASASAPVQVPGQAALCTDTVDTSSPVISDGFSFNLSNTRNGVSQINSSNVTNLQLAYAHAAVGSTMKRGAPAMTNQAIFLAASDTVTAINRISGCTYWTYQARAEQNPVTGSNYVRSSAIYYLSPTSTEPAVVLFGDSIGYFYAVNAQTGAKIWSKFVGEELYYHMITGSPQLYNGIMYLPISSKEVILTAISLVRRCCTSHGLLRAINPYTGDYLWTYDATAPAKLQADGHTMAPNGESMWGVPTIDPARNSIYVGTGQNLTPPVQSNSDSIIALDLTKGTVKWVFQGFTGDAWNGSCQLSSPFDFHCVPPIGYDYDFGAPPALVHLADGSDAIIAGEKSGMVFSINPDTGAMNWSTRIGQGGNLGGVHWGIAVDAHNVYASVSDVGVIKVSNIGGPGGMTQTPGATPGVYALDLMTGDLVWKFATTHTYQGDTYDSIFSAAPSVTNDLVFAGSLDGMMFALRSSDGKLMWSYNTAQSFTDVNGNPGNGGTIDSVGAVPAGTDLIINSGYDQFGGINEFQVGPGNAMYVFRLP